MSVSMPVTNADLNKIFWHGGAPLNTATGFANVTETPPVKTITITNNSNQTIYPILRDANVGKLGTLYYDPQDYHDQEFRAYIGYHTSEGDFLGLRSGETITIQVPLVFWDGANIYFATDGADLLGQRGVNPFDYNPDAQRYVVSAAADPFYNTQWVISSTGNAGLIMFYHDTTSHTFAPDAPAQLTEHTIRDTFLKKFNIDDTQAYALINYDVSYVNDQILPIAMEATNVGIPNINDPRLGTLGTENYGWLGANMSIDELREKIDAFTSSDKSKNGLGEYFGGLGWPSYSNADPADIHIPGGDNIFMNGPFNGTRSKYDQNAWALTSGGEAPIEATANATPTGTGTVIKLNFDTDADRIAFFDTLKKMKAVGTVNVNISPNTIYDTALATVVSFDDSPTNPTVTVDTAIVSPNASFRFYRPVTDYASTTITNLWYSWAKYYTSLFTTPAPSNVSGSINSGSNELHLSSVAGLEKGMMVTGSDTSIFPPDANGVGTVILSIDTTNNIVKLSQIAQATSQGGATYSFTNPTATAANGMTGILHGNDPTVQTFDLVFTDAQKEKAKLFAASVYTVMAAESAVNPLFPNSNTMPGSMKIIHGIIGGDLTHIPNNDPQTTGHQIRDLIKSVLRGVHDFLDPTVSESDWYPDPADNKDGGGQEFNVYNLDPYVWFVHKVLGLSGYGFSLDDDAADVQAIGPKPVVENGKRTDVQNLSITIGGIKGLGNQLEWFGGVPWGTVTDTATIYKYSGDETQFQGKWIIQLTTPKVYWQVKADNLPNALVGAYVSGPGIDTPLRLAGPGPASETALTFVLTGDATTNLTPATYTFSGKPITSDNVFKDAGFETPQLAADQFQHDPTNAWVWAGTNNEGISHNGSPYSVEQNAPEGQQVAYLQRGGSVAQTITVDKTGSYAISFYAAQRVGNDGDQEIQVYLNGTPVVGGLVKPSGTSYAIYTVVLPEPLVAGNHTIMLKGMKTATDSTALIDVVRLVQTSDVIVQDPGFETPALNAGQFQHDPSGTAWSWAGIANEGVSHNGPNTYNTGQNAPEGVQVAYIQRTGSVTQTVNLQAGSYEISFYAAQRIGNAQYQELQIIVDGEAKGAIKPEGTDYKIYTSAKFTVGAGSHTITIRGINPEGGDNTALIDVVKVNSVPTSSYNEEVIPWTPLGGVVQQLVTATNGNGQVQVFAIGADNALWYRTQSANNDPNSFGAWTSLGGFVKQIAVDQNADGTLQVFAIGGDNAAWTRVQDANGVFGAWTSLGGFVKQLTVAGNADGDLELFAIGGDSALWRKVQIDGTTFGAWTSLGGFVRQIVAAVNADDTVQVFAIGGDNALWTNKQSAPGGGGYSGWKSLGGFVKQIAVGANLDGALQVFAIGGDNAAWTRKQDSGPSDQSASFTSWASLGGFVKQVAVGDYGNGELALFVIGGDNAVYSRRQTNPGGINNAEFDPYVSYGGFVKQLVVDDNTITEAVHFFGIGGDNGLWTRGQDLPDTLVLDVTSLSGSAGKLLTEDSLGDAVQEAIRRWSATGLSDLQIAWLRGLDYRIANLSDQILGSYDSGKMVINVDAAGRGWLIDSTLELDEEFSSSGKALSDDAASVDLLTVVMHEMGHALGFDHADSGVMLEALATGTRWSLR